MLDKHLFKFKNFSTSLKVVIIFCTLVVLWMLSGLISHNQNSYEIHKDNAALNYEIVNSKSVEKAKIVNFTGIIESKNQIDLTNEVSGKVISILVNDGTKLDKDQPIIALEKKDYIDKLNSAQENLTSKKVLYESALKLSKRGLGSESNIAEAKSQLFQAQAQLKLATLDLDNTTIKAPYNGIIDQISVKEGSFLPAYSKVGEFISDKIIKIKFDVPYNQYNQVKNSIESFIILNGKKVEVPQITSLSEIADDNTKTYSAEIITKNIDNVFKSGQLIRVFINVGYFNAHKISQSTLSIDSDGITGVKVINNQNIVKFLPVEIIGEDSDGFWVINLPHQVKIITLGHSYLKSGEKL